MFQQSPSPQESSGDHFGSGFLAPKKDYLPFKGGLRISGFGEILSVLGFVIGVFMLLLGNFAEQAISVWLIAGSALMLLLASILRTLCEIGNRMHAKGKI